MYKDEIQLSSVVAFKVMIYYVSLTVEIQCSTWHVLLPKPTAANVERCCLVSFLFARLHDKVIKSSY